jgi:UDP-N-acetylmuramoyl-tripeptide--D-alanyl-D-alanine ligase
MTTWTLDRAAAAAGGTAVGSGGFERVVVDSREAGPGSLFVALRGEQRDGHEFCRAALEAGAAAVMVERGRMPPGGAGVEVADTLEALRALAVWRRADLEATVVAVTGSTGKTTTKDLIAGILGRGAHAAPRSFNNEIGVPLTVLGAPDGATHLVVEVGSRGRGHIALLAPAVRPDVAVITTIGAAHLETFGDVDGVREAKWELVEALCAGGIAVLPAGEPSLLGRRRGKVLSFGAEPGADVRVEGVRIDGAGRAGFVLEHGGDRVPVEMSAAGRHQPHNAAAAVAAAMGAGVPFAEAAGRVGSALPSRWRMEVHPGPITVVNDAYNANPASMASALETVAAMGGRPVAVLGMMRELGAAAPEAHHEVGAAARRLGYAAVVIVGEDPGIAAGAGPIGRPVADRAQAGAVLRGLLRDGDVVLVKASRAVGLETLADELVREVGIR